MDFEEGVQKIETPAYVIDVDLLIKNLKLLKKLSIEVGAKILLAQKAFSVYQLYPVISAYLNGSCSSSLFEAMLAKECFPGENHIFSPSYKLEEFEKIKTLCSHVIFNSFSQLSFYKNQTKNIEYGIRINPEYSEVKTFLYNPASPCSRLGVTFDEFYKNKDELETLSGIHFHTMCEQNADVFSRTLDIVGDKFGEFLNKVKWLNCGGGQLITSPDYDLALLISSIKNFKKKYNLEIYLEPGEAVVLNSGFLVSSVLGIIKNKKNIAILDTSAACHMPDVLEMPYRPKIIGESKEGFSYILGSPTCLAGDVVGEYAFEKELKIGDRLIFCDMSHYTMVKNNMFNGLNLPDIVIYQENKFELIKRFGYGDFKSRL